LNRYLRHCAALFAVLFVCAGPLLASEVDSEAADSESEENGALERPPQPLAVEGAERISPAARQALLEALTDGVADVEPVRSKADFELLGASVAPGDTARLAWEPDNSFAGIAVPTPVLVVNGVFEGAVLCLTAAVHGDELNGIEMVRRVMFDIDASKLAGTVVGVPIVNLLGFKRSSRYLPDRRDLNRYFPGNPRGSSASRIAHSFFSEVVTHCDVLIDLHTGSNYRTNLPQLRANLDEPTVRALADAFGDMIVVYSAGGRGTLRRAALEAGIPAVTLEAGEPLRLQDEEVTKGVQRIFAAMDQLGMYRTLRVWGNPAPVYYRSRWVRAETGGILLGDVELGERIEEGQILGRIVDPITNLSTDLVSRFEGRVIGMAVDQVVLPGFAAFHIGISPPQEQDEGWEDAEEHSEALSAGAISKEDLDDA
jgi:hypothetical protein